MPSKRDLGGSASTVRYPFGLNSVMYEKERDQAAEAQSKRAKLSQDDDWMHGWQVRQLLREYEEFERRCAEGRANV